MSSSSAHFSQRSSMRARYGSPPTRGDVRCLPLALGRYPPQITNQRRPDAVVHVNVPSDGCGVPCRYHGAEPTYEKVNSLLPLVATGLCNTADVEHVAIPVAMEVPIVCQNELILGLVGESTKEHRRIDCGAVRNVRRDVEGGRDVVGAVEIARVVGGPQHGSHGCTGGCMAAREGRHAQSP